MEAKLICLDTSVLIEYSRKKNKSKTLFYKLTEKYSIFSVSSITEYELYIGNTEEQNLFWDNFFTQVVVLPLDTKAVKQSVELYKQLKLKNKLIEVPDILIAGTAMIHNLPLATLNAKHFNRIDGLQLTCLDSEAI